MVVKFLLRTTLFGRRTLRDFGFARAIGCVPSVPMGSRENSAKSACLKCGIAATSKDVKFIASATQYPEADGACDEPVPDFKLDITALKKEDEELPLDPAPKKIKLSEDGEGLIVPSVPRLPRRKDGFSIDRYYETDYYFENGLRKVYPYFYTFTSHAKGRWVGQKMIDVFSKEFRYLPPDVYRKHAELGRCRVNYEKVDLEYVIKNNDLISNVVHRHEVPVAAAPLKIIHSDDDMLVLDKPSSIPIHPVGRYRHNTIVWILARDYGMGDLHTVHRLDRLTSGVLIFARRPQVARRLEEQMQSRSLSKEYLCKVDGKFPERVVCDLAIKTISFKIGLCRVAPDGKDCYTEFERLHFDEQTNTSIVLCRPKTGRMHQIRVHLQYLGFPIVDDPLYNSDAFGSKRGAGGDFDGMSNQELIDSLIKRHNAENYLMSDENNYDPPGEALDSSSDAKPASCDCGKNSRGIQTEEDGPLPSTPFSPDRKFDPDRMTFDSFCLECKRKYKEPTPDELVMCLHAWKYEGPGWSYQSEKPAWACYE